MLAKIGQAFVHLIGAAGALAFVVMFVMLLIEGARWGLNQVLTGPCTKEKMVQAVGGCDLLGFCGVTYFDGSTGRQSHPTPGAVYCVKHKERFSSEAATRNSDQPKPAPK